MNLTANSGLLAKAIRTVSGAISSRNDAQSAIGCIKVVARHGGAELIATDKEVAIITAVDATVDGDWEALLPFIPISRVLRESTATSSVTIDFKPGETHISCGINTFKFSVPASVDTFPAVPRLAPRLQGNDWSVKQKDMKPLLERTLIATDAASARYALGSVKFELEGDTIRLVATDGKRLAIATGTCVEGPEPVQGHSAGLVPDRAARLLASILKDMDDPVEMQFSRDNALFRLGEVTVYTRLCEGRFPTYQTVMPSEFTGVVEFQAGALNSVVRQAQIMTDVAHHGITFDFRDGVLRLTGQIEVGGVDITIPYSGTIPVAPLSMCIDPSLLADHLSCLDQQCTVSMKIVDSQNPIKLEVPNYSYLVMPMAG